MSTCAICLDTLKSPVALPCGHVYCHACIAEAINTTASPSSPITSCPTCREPVSTVTPNPLLIPPHLRPYILPPFRRLYLNAPAPSPTDPSSSSSSSSALADDVERKTARLHMENAILRQSCHAWRARANAHVTAHVGLTTLARLAQEQARNFRNERDELARKYDALKRKLSDVDRNLKCETEEEPVADGSHDWPEYHTRMLNGAETPAHTDLTHCETHLCPPEEVSSESGTEPQRTSKRRRTSHTPPCLEHPTKPATSTPAMVIPHLVSFRPPTTHS